MLILAGISIATLTGENGLLTKASNAEKETDIAETKEQIKIELMGKYDEEKTDYTNEDVIAAVYKITGKTVEAKAQSVESKKGNEVDISDLWVKKIQFTVKCSEYLGGGTFTYSALPGEKWLDWINRGVYKTTNLSTDPYLFFDYIAGREYDENEVIAFSYTGDYLNLRKGEYSSEEICTYGEEILDGYCYMLHI